MVGADGTVDLAEPAAAISDGSLADGEKYCGRGGGDAELRRARSACGEEGNREQHGTWNAAHR